MRRSSKERRSFFLVVLDGSTPGGDMSCPQCMPALSNHAPHPHSKRDCTCSSRGISHSKWLSVHPGPALFPRGTHSQGILFRQLATWLVQLRCSTCPDLIIQFYPTGQKITQYVPLERTKFKPHSLLWRKTCKIVVCQSIGLDVL